MLITNINLIVPNKTKNQRILLVNLQQTKEYTIMTYYEAILELVKIQDTIMVDRDDNKRMDVKIKPLYTRINLYTTGVRSIIMEHIANFEDIINTIKKEMQ